jgi:AmmeMemoRadiSam system protein A
MLFEISEEEKRALLADARETIAAHLEKRRPRYQRGGALRERIASGDSALTQPCGAFVTLHSEPAHRLRGCIGRMVSVLPLEDTVRAMAAAAAFEDPRFPPLRPGEPENCSIEISALSPMESCGDPRGVTVGVHGVYLIYRGRAGVFLPQVPVEQGWGLDEYLENICYKAGLPSGSWEAPGAQRFIFTAEVFHE